MNDSEQALRDYKASLYFDKDNKHVHRNMGNVNFFQTKNYKESIENLNKAIELGDDSPLVYLLLSMAQYNTFDCGFIDNTKTYLKLCKKSSCEDDHLRWVKQAVAAVKTSNMCKWFIASYLILLNDNIF